MRAETLDAVLLTTDAEFQYYSGFRTLFWQSPTRPWFLVVPARGGPVAVIPEIGASLMRSTWVEDIRTWPSPQPDDEGLSLLCEVMRRASRIGVPMGPETFVRMPARDFAKLRGLLRGSEFVDVASHLQAQRMVKSELEIAALREICGIASRAFAGASELFSEGQLLSAAFRDFRIALLQEGAEDVPYLVGGAGPGGNEDVISPPGQKTLESGDILMLDTGATKSGYFCDFDRNFAIGHADDRAQRAYERLYQATEAGLDAARPGVPCSEVWKIMARVIGQDSGDVGRLGHGLGLQLTEAPSLARFDDTVLRAGMVITLEPSMVVSPGKVMVHEENILVRDGLPELLSERAARELPVL